MLSAQVHDQSSLGLTMSAHQIFSGAPSTITANSSALEQKKKPLCKRKRTTDAASDTDSTSHTTRTRDGPKKKKANRACFHCQKAHLTCDDSRPCQRCIKRGMADNCTEGHRKKAKYLLDEEELEALKQTKSSETPSKSAEAPIQPTSSEPGSYAQSEPMFTTYDSAATFPFQPSEAANLEYSILSTILGNSPESSTGSPATVQAQVHSHTHPPRSNSYATQQSPTSLVNNGWPSDPQYQGTAASSNSYNSAGPSAYSQQQPLSIQPSDTTLNSSSRIATSNGYITPTTASFQQSSSQYATPGSGPSSAQGQDVQYSEYPNQSNQEQSSSTSLGQYNGQVAQPSQAVQLLQRQPVIPPTRSSSATLMDRTHSSGTASWVGPAASELGLIEGTSVYKSVTKPYDYTEGYHFLMKHISTRGFDKNDILRIVRALAIYRPSLIALQMPMSEEDEVFVEKCFQRSLVELDKLVSFSGTPTLAWRRTGEICLVGPEFCMLTGWEREELIGRKKYVYELFENQSVVEYWENFANHAFENTTQSVYSHCVLLKPSGAPVPCTFCFSIRRDIMDLPSLVIGQWLPLL